MKNSRNLPVPKGYKNRDQPSDSSQEKRPKFSLEHIMDNYFFSNTCHKDKKVHFINALRTLSQLTWDEITKSPRHGNGYEKITKDSILASKPNTFVEREFYLSFRYEGKLPFVGFRESEKFYVVWIEEKFGDVYKHS